MIMKEIMNYRIIIDHIKKTERKLIKHEKLSC